MNNIRRRPPPKFKHGELILSFSAYKLYRDCPGAYCGKYITRAKIPPDVDKTATVPGSIIDRLNRTFFRILQSSGRKAFWLYNPTSKAFKEEFDRWIDQPKVFLGEGQFAKNREEAFEYVAQVAEKMRQLIESEQLAEDFDFVLSEWETDNPTEFGSPGNPLVVNDWVKLMGSFDFFGSKSRATPGRLLDWKASRSMYHLDPFQLRIYQLAAELKWDLKVGMTGFALPIMRRVTWHRFGREQVQETIERLVTTAKQIDAEEFDLTPSEASCRLCPFLTTCPKAVVSGKQKKREKSPLQIATPPGLAEDPEL